MKVRVCEMTEREGKGGGVQRVNEGKTSCVKKEGTTNGRKQ